MALSHERHLRLIQRDEFPSIGWRSEVITRGKNSLCRAINSPKTKRVLLRIVSDLDKIADPFLIPLLREVVDEVFREVPIDEGEYPDTITRFPVERTSQRPRLF